MDDYKELVERLAVVWGTPLGKEAAEAIERLSAERDDLIGMREEVLHYQREFHRVRDELAALKSASAEPVAWCVGYDDWKSKTSRCIYSNPTMYRPEAEALIAKAGGDLVLVPLFDRPAPAAVPEGWQLVPKEPTEEMLVALDEHGMHYDGCNNSWFVPLKAYHGMLAAAPKPPVQEDAKDAALKQGETK